MSSMFMGKGSNGLQVNFHCHFEGKDDKRRKSGRDKDKDKPSSSKMPHQDKEQSSSSKSSSKKDKSSSKHPLWDEGVGYTHVIVTLRLATLYSETASADGAQSDTDRSPWWQARLDTLEQALRNKQLYIPLAAGLRIPTAAAELIDRYNAAFTAAEHWGSVLTRLEGELHGAGLVDASNKEDWTFHNGSWFCWDPETGGHVYESGARYVYISRTGTWELLEPTPGVVDADAAEEDCVPGGLDADANECES